MNNNQDDDIYCFYEVDYVMDIARAIIELIFNPFALIIIGITIFQVASILNQCQHIFEDKKDILECLGKLND